MRLAAVAEADRRSSTAGRAWLWATAALTACSLVAVVALAPPAGATPVRALSWLLFTGSSVHVASTGWLFLVPAVRSYARQHRLRCIWIPVGLIGSTAIAAAMIRPTAFQWLLLPYFSWQFYHYQKQNMGMTALAAASSRAGQLRRAERRSLLLAGLATIGALAGDPRLLGLRIALHAPWLRLAALAVFAVAVAAGVLALATRPATARPTGFTVIYLTSLLFGLPAFVFASPYAAVGGMTVAHGLQYLLLISLIASQGVVPEARTASTATQARPSRLVRLALLANIALIGGVLLSVASHLHNSSQTGRLIFGAYLGVVMAHFVIDAGIWRMSDPLARKFLTENVPFLNQQYGNRSIVNRYMMHHEQVTEHRWIGRARDARQIVGSGQPDPVEPGRRRQAWLRADQGHRIVRRGQARPRNAIRGAQQARGAWPDRCAGKPESASALPPDRSRSDRAEQLPQGPATSRRSRTQPPREHLGPHMTRMLLWYPSAWRARYGDEFAELLAAELAERPRDRRRTVNIAFSGVRARLADAGLISHPLDHAAAARAGLATLACCGALFATFGAAMWSQLATSLQWAVPDNLGITQALDLMSLALLTFCVVAALGLAELIRAAVVTVARHRGRALLGPTTLAVVSAAILLFGGRHFANAWPGTGGHLLTTQGLVPAGLVAFCWSITMWITSYWAHPAMLAVFPATQIAWMTLAPLAACGLMTGMTQLIRRLNRSPRALSFETWLGRVAGGGMLIFLCGVLRWLSAGQRPTFHVGSIDVAGLTVLVLVVTTGLRTIRLVDLSGTGTPRQ
jgi:hypothetical protein